MSLLDRPANHRASRVTILVAAAVAAVIVGLLVYLAAVAPRGLPTRDYYDIDARFADTTEIKLLSSVTLNGRRVGQVSDIRSDGEVSHLNLQLDPGTELRSDATARIRIKNPVGAKYVNLDPGRAGTPLPDGGAIPVTQTSSAIDTPDLLSTFDAETRDNASTAVQGLGRGFIGRGQEINETLPEAPGLLRDTRSEADAILARPGAAARFFPSARTLADAYDPVRGDLGAGLRPEADVLEAFADSGIELQRTLDVAPSSLEALREGFDRATPLLEETTGFARATARLTGPLPAGLREATALLRTGGPALQDADPLLDAVGASVTPTLAVLADFRPQIDPTIEALSKQMRPLVELARRPCDVLFQANVWRSALSFGVPVDTDPTSELDFSQGIGRNNNSFRVLGVAPVTTEALLADSPGAVPTIAENAYPDPCVAPEDVKP
jgi:virulence factor Mce-like protein